jgi:uncharacterized protein YdaU (DUF1376 family)
VAKKLPYYKMYPNDFDADEKVRLLDCREAGLYLFALNHSWNNDGLPGDDGEVGKMLKVPIRDFRLAWPAVKKCFVLCEDGRLRNMRQEDERVKAITKSDTASISAVSSQEHEPGYIYLARRDSDGAIKIGSSNNVPRRIAQLKYKHRDSISLVGSFAVPDMCDAESALHKRFSNKRLHGEWFSISKEDIAAITPVGDMKGDMKGDIKGDNQNHPAPRAYESNYESESVEVKPPEENKPSRVLEIDEQWTEFCGIAKGFWLDLIPEDLSGWRFAWSAMDFEAKALAIQRLNERIAAGQPFQKVFKPTYFTRGEWKRPVASPVAQDHRTARQRAVDEALMSD